MDDRDSRWRAVELAYRDHADDVYRVALAILRDPDAAVDVTHDTFARAFDRWDQYDANRTPDGATSSDAASIIVYDTTDGSVRLLAGQLGTETLTFTGPVVR